MWSYFLFLIIACIFDKSNSWIPSEMDPVIVVGGGLAGLSATISAISEGSSVLLIEGEKDVGGNSAKASSGIAACNTDIQRALGIEDSTDSFYIDTINAGDRENDAALVDILIHESANAIRFLIEHGVNISDVNLCGGHSTKRVHWIYQRDSEKPVSIGWEIIKALKQKVTQAAAENPEKVKVLLNTEVVGIVTWNDFVTGVRIRTRGSQTIDEIPGKAVILATGGFSNDRFNEDSLLMEYAPDLASFPTTNGHWASGRGVKMARAMGAALVGMNRIQVHPTAFVDPKALNASTKFLAAEALRGVGAILINVKGERFVNELGRRDHVTDRIIRVCGPNALTNSTRVAFMLMNDEMVNNFGRASFNFYANTKGFFKKFDSVNELALHIDVGSLKLRQTLIDYNSHVKSKAKDAYDKTIFPSAIDPDSIIYMALITPAIHYTMGGIKIDNQGFVFNEFSGKPFKGLLAAGEVSGGVHGSNRLAGNSLLECVVFGRLAGRSAARIHYSPDMAYPRQEL